MLSYLVFKDFVDLHFRKCKGGDDHVCDNKLLHDVLPTLFIGLDRLEEFEMFERFCNEYYGESDKSARIEWLARHRYIFEDSLKIELFKYNKKGLYGDYPSKEYWFLDYLLRNLYNEFSNLFN